VHDFFNFGGEGKIYETFDGGTTWNEINPEGTLYRTDLSYVPGTENTWVSSGCWNKQIGQGASVSYDGGHTWTDFTGTCGTKFRNMAWINESCGWAGGYNDNDSVGGMYKYCGDLLVGMNDEKLIVPGSGFRVDIYPNPCQGSFKIRVSSFEFQKLRVSLYNLQGQEVGALMDKELPAGEHQFSFDVSGLPEGMYFLRATAGDEAVSKKLIILY
jgi:hypothetical protein